MNENTTPERPECEGHPAGPFDPMGVTVYCDGSCQTDALVARSDANALDALKRALDR